MPTLGVETVLTASEGRTRGEKGALGGSEEKEGGGSLGLGGSSYLFLGSAPRGGQTLGMNGQGAWEAGPRLSGPSFQQHSLSWLGSGATGLQGQVRAWTLWLEASHGPVPGRDRGFPPCPLADEDEE